jgi:trehalose 2-sulfotransferase
MVRLIETEEFWRRYFEERGIQPLIIRYDDLVDDYEGTIIDTLMYLNIELPAGFRVPHPRLLRQSNATNEEWVAKYLDLLAKDTPTS